MNYLEQNIQAYYANEITLEELKKALHFLIDDVTIPDAIYTKEQMEGTIGYNKVIDAINKGNCKPKSSDAEQKVYARLVDNYGSYAIECIAGTTITVSMLAAGNGHGIHGDYAEIHTWNNATITIEFH